MHAGQIDADLAQGRERWPALPENVKEAILDFVETAARHR